MQQLQAMRAAGVACFLCLAAIAGYVFFTPSSDLIDQLTLVGAFLGGGTTYGVLSLAALPPLAGFIFYWIWKWAAK